MNRTFAAAALLALGCSDPASEASPGSGSTGAAPTSEAATTTSGGEVETATGASTGEAESGSEGSSGSTSATDSGSSSSDDGDTGSSSGSESSTGEPLVPGPCGDGVLNLGEACDDGNEEDGDGCSADCSAASCLVPVTHETVQAGVDDAACPTIWILPGTYVENIDITRDLTLVGVDFEPVVLDGGAAGSVVTTTEVDVVFRHLRITGGLAELGAGINADDGRISLDGCQVDGNRAEADAEIAWAQGGGIAGHRTWVELYGGTEITNNVAAASTDDGGSYAEGGGVFLDSGRAYISGGVLIDGNRAEVTNGGTNSSAHGGGLYADAAIVEITASTLSNNVVSANAANSVYAYGGGMYQSTSGFIATDAVFEDNLCEVTSVTATNAGAFGGGLYLGAYDPVIERSLIASNRVAEANGNEAEGGGVFFYTTQGQILTVVETAVVDNEADATGGRGGGLYANANGQNPPGVEFVRSLATGNSAAAEGGFAFLTGGPRLDVELTNATISDNTAGEAGAVYFGGTEAELFVSSTTITRNNAMGTGGVVMVDDISGVIRNSILWGNGGADCSFLDAATLTSAGYNVVDCTLGGDQTGNLSVDPELGPLGDNGGSTHTHALASTSPARNAGDPGGCTDNNAVALAEDQRGEDRHTEDLCDIGAFEYVP